MMASEEEPGFFLSITGCPAMNDISGISARLKRTFSA